MAPIGRQLTLAVALGMALVLAAVGGSFATSLLRSGGPVRAMKVATADQEAATDSNNWTDIPNMTVTMTVPSGEKGLFLATLSGETACSGALGNECRVRVTINGNTLAPAAADIGVIFASATTTGTRYASSAQLVSGPLSAGSYTIKAQYRIYGAGYFQLERRTLSVVRSKV
jgi:hypothetical protein